MKTVTMDRDFDYRPVRNWGVRFQAGITYQHVIEAAVTAIVTAGAGRVVESTQPCDGAAGQIASARHVWRR